MVMHTTQVRMLDRQLRGKRENNVNKRCKVLVINDLVFKGGAEEVYRTSARLLRAMPDVDVECFDSSRLSAAAPQRPHAWNTEAAALLAQRIARFRPDRVLVHNYHNVLSPSVLRVIGRYRSSLGYTSYLTCHDYHTVHYNPTLLCYKGSRIDAFPIESLGTLRALVTRASPKGALHDALKKLYWHSTRLVCHPARVFDLLLCPSRYMEQALRRSGITHTMLLPNPVDTDTPILAPRTVCTARIDLAYVGRIAAEKGLGEFIALARSTHFACLNKLIVFGDGPERAALEQRHADLIHAGRLEFRGRLPHRALLAELRESAHAMVLPSICAENAPLSLVESAMLGLPALVHDVGSLSTFGDEIGNKFRYRNDVHSYQAALGALIRHLARPNRRYDVTEYSPQRYAQRLAAALRLKWIDGAQAGRAASLIDANSRALPIA